MNSRSHCYSYHSRFVGAIVLRKNSLMSTGKGGKVPTFMGLWRSLPEAACVEQTLFKTER